MIITLPPPTPPLSPYLEVMGDSSSSSSAAANASSSSSSASASYIHKVQHLIEKCLIFHLSKEECMEALSKHADIKPVITSTVWNELEKENKEFFEAYYTTQAQTKDDRLSEAETNELIQKMITESSSKDHQESSKDSADSSKDPADT